MIEFSCHCSYAFSLPTDQAGGLIQCPQCGRLNDIPTLSDVDNLEDGGIYKIEAPPQTPHGLPQAFESYTRARHDDSTGDDYDLRPSAQDILNSGTEEIPLDLADQVRPGAPRYDPETGELIEPLTVRRDDLNAPPIDPSTIPMAKTALGYATADMEMIVDTGPRAFWQLFKPMNVLVIGIVMVMHYLTYMVGLVAIAGFFFLIPVAFLMFTALVSHWGCVVDETGPTANQELPRPLRNVSWHDDLWGPAFQIYTAALLCYLPIPLAFIFRIHGTVVGQGLILTTLIFGTLLFPAAVLTSLTSGAVENLRPDRLLGLIRTLGMRYWMILLLGLASMGVYIAGNVLAFTSLANLFVVMKVKWLALSWLMGIASLAAGLFMMHWMCWYLGLQYRRWHDRFPWVLQRHVSTRRDTQKQLEARRRRQMQEERKRKARQMHV